MSQVRAVPKVVGSLHYNRVVISVAYVVDLMKLSDDRSSTKSGLWCR